MPTPRPFSEHPVWSVSQPGSTRAGRGADPGWARYAGRGDLRRYWQPLWAFGRERQTPAARMRILGEDLVVFRDGGGRVGLLAAALQPPRRLAGVRRHRRARHRAAAITAGRYDVDGTLLETPVKPAGKHLQGALCHGGYPVHVFQGGVSSPTWRRLTRSRRFPILDTLELPGFPSSPPRAHYVPCNWLQIKENGMDPAHTVFLHARVSGVAVRGRRARSWRAALQGDLRRWGTPTSTPAGSTTAFGDMGDWMPPRHQFPPGKGGQGDRLPAPGRRRCGYCADRRHELPEHPLHADEPGRNPAHRASAPLRPIRSVPTKSASG